jgi:hypothetical protein
VTNGAYLYDYISNANTLKENYASCVVDRVQTKIKFLNETNTHVTMRIYLCQSKIDIGLYDTNADPSICWQTSVNNAAAPVTGVNLTIYDRGMSPMRDPGALFNETWTVKGYKKIRMDSGREFEYKINKKQPTPICPAQWNQTTPVSIMKHLTYALIVVLENPMATYLNTVGDLTSHSNNVTLAAAKINYHWSHSWTMRWADNVSWVTSRIQNLKDPIVSAVSDGMAAVDVDENGQPAIVQTM